MNSFAIWRRRRLSACAGSRQGFDGILLSTKVENGPQATQRRSLLHCSEGSAKHQLLHRPDTRDSLLVLNERCAKDMTPIGGGNIV